MAVMKTLEHNQSYYVDGVLQLAAAGEPELAYWNKAKDIIDLYIFTGLAYGTINVEGISQNTSGSNAEAGGKTNFAANMAVIDNVVDNGILNLPTLVSSAYVFANFTYEPNPCERDMGYNIDGL